MNWQRVILGGLVAGMLINLIETACSWQKVGRLPYGAEQSSHCRESDCCVLYLGLCLLGAAICSTSNIAFADS
jgi:hypothetical protein